MHLLSRTAAAAALCSVGDFARDVCITELNHADILCIRTLCVYFSFVYKHVAHLEPLQTKSNARRRSYFCLSAQTLLNRRCTRLLNVLFLANLISTKL